MKKILVLVLLLLINLGFSQNKFDFAVTQHYQNQLNSEYADVKTSPLTAEDLALFKTLQFYPIDEKYFIKAQFIRTKDEKPFEMATSTDRKPVYVKYGEAHFELEGKSFKLNIYQNIELTKKEEYKNHLFLPFSDLTSGNDSYIGGRYIDLKIPKGKTISIDFNTSYNPYCAYNPKYSCPKVPIENDLAIEIKAGVKKFHD